MGRVFRAADTKESASEDLVRMMTPSSLMSQAMIWISVPLLIFVFGWFRLWIACTASLLLVVALLPVFGVGARKLYIPDSMKSVRLDKSWVIMAVAIFLFLIWFGHGGLVRQPWDWQFRNAVFFDLVRHPWPVVYDAETPRLLCYYFVFFLPGALVSKFTGSIMIGDLVQLLYAFWGVVLGYSLICSLCGGRSRWWMGVIWLCFAGADKLTCTLLAFNTPIGEWWNNPLFIYDYYSSYTIVVHFGQIFNQAIPYWILLPLIWAYRRNAGWLTLLSVFLFVYAPLPCVGIVLPAIWWVIKEIRSFWSVRTLAGLAVGVPTALFYVSNANASSPGVTPTLDSARIALLCVNFAIFGIAIWLPFIWQSVRRSLTFWLMALVSLILPFWAMGDSCDFGIRPSIPMFVYMFYALLRTINRRLQSKSLRPGWLVALCCVLLMTSYETWSFGGVLSRQAIEYGKWGSEAKRFELVGRLDDPSAHIFYHNFVAEGKSIYTRVLAPRLK